MQCGRAGERCERCADGPACAPGGVCSVVDGRGYCATDLCRGFCLNGVSGRRRGGQGFRGGSAGLSLCLQAACELVQGAAVCACGAGLTGMRCERRERERAPTPVPTAHDNDTPPRRLGDDDHDLRPHREYSHQNTGYNSRIVL